MWRRPGRPPPGEQWVNRLLPDEQENVRVALRFMRARLGELAILAKEMKLSYRSLSRALEVGGRPSAGMAIRVARVAGVPVEKVLAGKWPRPGECPVCGHRKHTK